MRKSLSLMLSAALTLGSVSSVTAAPLAQKAGGKVSGPEAAASVLKSQAKAQSAKKGMKLPQARTFTATPVKGLKCATPKTVSANKRALSSATAASSALKLPAAGTDLRGVQIWNDEWQTTGEYGYGMYNLPTSDAGSFSLLGPLDMGYFHGYDDGEGTFYAFSYTSFWGIFDIFAVDIVDTETWTTVGTLSDDGSLYGFDTAVDPTTGKVYGSFLDVTTGDALWSTVDYVNLTRSDIAVLDAQLMAVGCTKDGQFYGVDENGLFCKIDKETGEVDLISDTGIPMQYVCSGCVNDKNNTLLCSFSTDAQSGLAEIDLETGEAILVKNFENNEEVTCMYINVTAEDKAPDAPELAVSCENGSMDATITLKMPETLYDGTPAAGQTFGYKVLADGAEVMTGTAAAGAEVSETVTLTTSGAINFVAVATNETGESPKAKVVCYVGKGTPAAPANVTAAWSNGNVALDWSAVTEAADGGYLEASEVTYSVYDVDGAEVANGLAATHLDIALAEPAGVYKIYSYSVKANYAGKSSAAAKSNEFGLGAYDAPVELSFATDGIFGQHIVVDDNNDGRTWALASGAARYTYSATYDADDWLISPAFNLEAGKAYEFSAEVGAQGTSYPEQIEIMLSNTPEAAEMSTEVVAKTTIAGSEHQEINGLLKVDATGRYYLGFHAVSPADMYYLYVYGYKIGAAIDAAAPAAVTDLKVAPDAHGALKAAISFKAPATTVGGDALTGDVKVQILRNGELIKELSAAAGASMSVEDAAVAEEGTYTYTVVPSNAAGEGISSKQIVFVGAKTPVAVTGILGSEKDGTVTLSWNAVTLDTDGEALLPENVSYNVYAGVVADNTLTVGDKLNDSPITANSFTTEITPLTEQDFIYFYVESVNCDKAGKATSFGFVAGPAYEMPVVYTGMESLKSYFLSYGGNGSAGIGSSSFGFPAQDGDDEYFAVNVGQYLDSETFIETGKIAITGEHPVLTFYLLPIADDDTNLTQVYVDCGGDETLLAEITHNEYTAGEWNKIKLSLEDYIGQDVQIKLNGVVKKYIYNLYDNIKIAEDVDYDLSASAAAPASVATDEPFDFEVYVTNEGVKAAENFTVTCYRNGEPVETRNIATLAAGARLDFLFTQQLGLHETSAEFKAVVSFDADQDLANNETKTLTVTRTQSKLPKVTGLAGEITDNGHSLTWDAIDLSNPLPAYYTEDFESGESFAQEFEGWTILDVDGNVVGGFQGVDVPGITPGASTAAFFLFDASYEQFNESYTAASGDKYLAAMFDYQGGQTDDWAISPELLGNAQTVSFKARSYSSQYPEALQLLYTTAEDETDLDSYVKALDIPVVPGEWTEYSAEIPAGATHFALRSYGTDAFMLMVDDVTYEAITSVDAEHIGYNVYCDNAKVNDAPLTEAAYIHLPGDEADHTYHVSAVYAEGESELSEPVTLSQSGVSLVQAAKQTLVSSVDRSIVVTGAEGLNVTIAAVDGKVIYSGAGNAKVAVVPAVYLVTVDGKTVKLLVK